MIINGQQKLFMNIRLNCYDLKPAAKPDEVTVPNASENDSVCSEKRKIAATLISPFLCRGRIDLPECRHRLKSRVSRLIQAVAVSNAIFISLKLCKNRALKLFACFDLSRPRHKWGYRLSILVGAGNICIASGNGVQSVRFVFDKK